MSTALERVIAEQQAKIDSQRKTIDHQVADMVRLNSSMQSLVSEVFVLLNNPSELGAAGVVLILVLGSRYAITVDTRTGEPV